MREHARCDRRATQHAKRSWCRLNLFDQAVGSLGRLLLYGTAAYGTGDQRWEDWGRRESVRENATDVARRRGSCTCSCAFSEPALPQKGQTTGRLRGELRRELTGGGQRTRRRRRCWCRGGRHRIHELSGSKDLQSRDTSFDKAIWGRTLPLARIPTYGGLLSAAGRTGRTSWQLVGHGDESR